MIAVVYFLTVGSGQQSWDVSTHLGTSSSRNERSTPRTSVLPSSPAIADLTISLLSKPTKQEILLARAILMRQGYDVGNLTGELDAKMRAALFRFQHAKGLPTSAELDAPTRAVLGFGVQ